MTLEFKNVSKFVDGQIHIHPTDLTLEKGTMNVLLGPTLSGKTSLMRLMAGLDVPASGQILWNGNDVTGKRVQDRKVAMVYQQFINYPSMSVYDNIASPMKLMGIGRGISASKYQVREAHNAIAKWLEQYRVPLPILYGGSVKSSSAASLSSIQNVDGFLIGGASLDPKEFEIIGEIVAETLGNSMNSAKIS